MPSISLAMADSAAGPTNSRRSRGATGVGAGGEGSADLHVSAKTQARGIRVKRRAKTLTPSWPAQLYDAVVNTMSSGPSSSMEQRKVRSTNRALKSERNSSPANANYQSESTGVPDATDRACGSTSEQRRAATPPSWPWPRPGLCSFHHAMARISRTAKTCQFDAVFHHSPAHPRTNALPKYGDMLFTTFSGPAGCPSSRRRGWVGGG